MWRHPSHHDCRMGWLDQSQIDLGRCMWPCTNVENASHLFIVVSFARGEFTGFVKSGLIGDCCALLGGFNSVASSGNQGLIEGAEFVNGEVGKCLDVEVHEPLHGSPPIRANARSSRGGAGVSSSREGVPRTRASCTRRRATANRVSDPLADFLCVSASGMRREGETLHRARLIRFPQ